MSALSNAPTPITRPPPRHRTHAANCGATCIVWLPACACSSRTGWKDNILAYCLVDNLLQGCCSSLESWSSTSASPRHDPSQVDTHTHTTYLGHNYPSGRRPPSIVAVRLVLKAPIALLPSRLLPLTFDVNPRKLCHLGLQHDPRPCPHLSLPLLFHATACDPTVQPALIQLAN